jgi:acyl carrier protein
MTNATSQIVSEKEQQIIEILSDIRTVKGLPSCQLSSETVLDQLGLESLDFAQVVIRMEELTGKDPFATGAEFQIRILADLAELYK